MAKRYLFEGSENVAPVGNDNLKFKKRTKGGYPKMNFHVFAIPRGDAAGTGAIEVDNVKGGAFPISSWRYLGGFTDLSGLTKTGEVITTTNSDSGNKEVKSKGKVTYNNITLNRGYDSDAFISGWAAQNLNYLGNSDRHLLDLCILKLTSSEKTIAKVIYVANAWPTTYTAGDMDTTTTDPWVETLELAIDAWEYGFLNSQADMTKAMTSPNTISVGTDTDTAPSGNEYLVHSDFQGGFYYDELEGEYVEVTQTTFLNGLTGSYSTAN